MNPDSPTKTDTSDGGLQSWLVVYLKGLAMGCADSVPGVSGGTIALIVGIYERLITALTELDPAVVQYIPGLSRQHNREQFVRSLRAMDVPFLVLLGSGMVTAVVILARVIQIALTNIPGPTFAFFFGLIGASAIILADPAWLKKPPHIVGGVAGFVVAFLVAGASGQGAVPSSYPVIFLSGALAISGMILPGISGAFILLLLGQYDHMTATLNSFVDAVIGVVGNGITTQLVRESLVVGTFLTGAVVGLLTIAYAVRWALDRYRGPTLAFLVSLMLGSLRLPVIEMRAAAEPAPASVGPLIATAVFGAVIVLLLDWYTEDLSY